MMGDVNGARSSLSYVRERVGEIQAVPYWFTPFLMSEMLIYLHEMVGSAKSYSISESRKNRKRAEKTGKKMIRESRKSACWRTESLRLMGIYYWLIDKQKRALKWWHKSIHEGERLGARPELSRTYMEVGKRLLEPKSKCEELNGISAEEYLEKARVMFEEMGLQWDLEELERIVIPN